jgi:hypothetical protein
MTFVSTIRPPQVASCNGKENHLENENNFQKYCKIKNATENGFEPLTAMYN